MQPSTMKICPGPATDSPTARTILQQGADTHGNGWSAGCLVQVRDSLPRASVGPLPVFAAHCRGVSKAMLTAASFTACLPPTVSLANKQVLGAVRSFHARRSPCACLQLRRHQAVCASSAPACRRWCPTQDLRASHSYRGYKGNLARVTCTEPRKSRFVNSKNAKSL